MRKFLAGLLVAVVAITASASIASAEKLVATGSRTAAGPAPVPAATSPLAGTEPLPVAVAQPAQSTPYAQPAQPGESATPTAAKLTGEVFRFDVQPRQIERGDPVTIAWDTSSTCVRMITPSLNSNRAPSGLTQEDTSSWPDGQLANITMQVIVDGENIGAKSAAQVQVGTSASQTPSALRNRKR